MDCIIGRGRDKESVQGVLSSDNVLIKWIF